MVVVVSVSVEAIKSVFAVCVEVRVSSVETAFVETEVIDELIGSVLSVVGVVEDIIESIVCVTKVRIVWTAFEESEDRNKE